MNILFVEKVNQMLHLISIVNRISDFCTLLLALLLLAGEYLSVTSLKHVYNDKVHSLSDFLTAEAHMMTATSSPTPRS